MLFIANEALLHDPAHFSSHVETANNLRDGNYKFTKFSMFKKRENMQFDEFFL